ncbi:MAG: hypothetical protein AVDCRST_MAG64-770, partial [uncultured Phycisphaerae bacterium]
AQEAGAVQHPYAARPPEPEEARAGPFCAGRSM